ncbi:MAG TPA: hypothetical protein VIU63_05445 [Nitrospira sp.]
MIPVASLSSRSLTNDIVAFVRAVIDLKNKFKTGGAAKVTSTTKWREGKESEGRKKGRRSAAEFEYEYLHGPVCNALQTAFKKLPGAGKDFVVRRNKQVDLALVQREKPIAIFEVKTSASLSKQLYSAIGQLLYYRRKYGGPETKLFLVLPSVAVPRGFPHSKFFDSLDVYVVFVDDNGSFYLSNSKTLRAILEDSGCIPKPSTRMAPKRTRPTKSARVGNLVLKGASKFPQEGRLSGTKIDDDSKIELTAPQVESTEGLPSAAG